MSVSGCILLDYKYQKTAWGSHELELQVVLSSPVRVLDIKHESSGSLVHTYSSWSTSPVPIFFIWNDFDDLISLLDTSHGMQRGSYKSPKASHSLLGEAADFDEFTLKQWVVSHNSSDKQDQIKTCILSSIIVKHWPMSHCSQKCAYSSLSSSRSYILLEKKKTVGTSSGPCAEINAEKRTKRPSYRSQR